MQVMQNLLRQGKALQFYADCSWKPPRDLNLLLNTVCSQKWWGMDWKEVRVGESRTVGRLCRMFRRDV